MSRSFTSAARISNPLDTVEQLISERDWSCDRPDTQELLAEVSTGWCNYRIWLTWQPELGVLIFSCGFEGKVPDCHREKLYPMLAAINEKLWLGHFDICSDEHTITFRHALLLRGLNGATSEQLEDLLDIALVECDRFYPAFQSVMWGGKTLGEAVDIALMETVGEA